MGGLGVLVRHGKEASAGVVEVTPREGRTDKLRRLSVPPRGERNLKPGAQTRGLCYPEMVGTDNK